MSNTKLFEFMYDAVIGEGGDGDLTLVLMCQDYKTVSDEFYAFLGTKCDLAAWPWHRQEQDGLTVFYHDQESFCITNKRLDNDMGHGYSQLIATL